LYLKNISIKDLNSNPDLDYLCIKNATGIQDGGLNGVLDIGFLGYAIDTGG
jgi:hypothetical protein